MFLLAAAALVALDQITKLWAEATFPLGGPGMYVALGFHFTNVRNTGAAFGIFQDGTLLLAILSAVVSVALLAYLVVNRRRLPPLQMTGFTLILAGAVGNMIDRIRLGYVIDFIHFRVGSFSFPVFNVADTCVVIGAGLLILASFLGEKERPPAATAGGTNERAALEEPEFFRPLERDDRE